jgi:hypothetical protein
LISQFRCRKNYAARLSEEEVRFIRSAGFGPGANRGVGESGERGEPGEPGESGQPREYGESSSGPKESDSTEEEIFEAYKITARYKMLLDAVEQLEGFDLKAYEMTVEVGKFLGRHFVGVKDPNSPDSSSSSRPGSSRSSSSKEDLGGSSRQTAKQGRSSWFPTLTSKKKSIHQSKLHKGGEFIPDASLPEAKKVVMMKYEGMFKGIGELFETVKIWRELYAEFYGVEEEAWVVVEEESWKDS